MIYNASRIANYSLAMFNYRVKQFVNAVIYPIFGFSECISLAIIMQQLAAALQYQMKNRDGSFLGSFL
jgi:hypothetical protein